MSVQTRADGHTSCERRKQKGKEAVGLQDAQCSGSKHTPLGLGWWLVPPAASANDADPCDRWSSPWGWGDGSSLCQHQQMMLTLVTRGPQGKQNQTWTSLAHSCAQSSSLLTHFSSRLWANLNLENFLWILTSVKSIFKKGSTLGFLLLYFLLYAIQRRAGRAHFQHHIRNPLHLEWLLHLKSLKWVLIQNSITPRALCNVAFYVNPFLRICRPVNERNMRSIICGIKGVGNPGWGMAGAISPSDARMDLTENLRCLRSSLNIVALWFQLRIGDPCFLSQGRWRPVFSF